MQMSIARTQNRTLTQIIQNKFFVFKFMLTRFRQRNVIKIYIRSQNYLL